MKVSLAVLLTCQVAEAVATTSMGVREVEADISRAVGDVLEVTSDSVCSFIFITDGATHTFPILKSKRFQDLDDERSSPRGVTVMEVRADGQDGNVTQAMLYHLVGQARQVRLRSWCVSVVVVSHDPAFLTAFAESSLKGRLLVWATRLLVITSLTLPQLHALLPAHWTFSMMNTIFLNLEITSSDIRVSTYSHLPYSQAGAQVVRIASWTPAGGLHMLIQHQLFPEKFDDFQGATVPVTALPFPPYWVEEDQQAADGTTVRSYTGTDGELLHCVANALNLTFYVLPTTSWAEVVKLVEERKSLMAAVYHMVLPQRLERFDMTYAYEYAILAFSMRKPGLSPRWQSLYYPLTDLVWGSVLTLLLCVPAVLIMVIRVGQRRDGGSRLGAGSVVQDMAGMLLGQNLPRRLPTTSSSRLLVAAWLVFAFIIGTVYRGNLTAHLTLPKYPPRPETVEHLVEVIDRATWGPYGAAFKVFFGNSEYEVFQKFSQLLLIGPSVLEGLQQALDHNQAVVEGRRYMEHIIAENFTRPDGSTDLYVGRQHILPGLSAWPIPHDAPYRPQLDRCIMAVIEAGLYEKWSGDQMAKARRQSSRRQREYLAQQQQQQQQERQGTRTGRSVTSLTVTHIQGSFMLLLLGYSIAGVSFTFEVFARLYLL